MSSRTYLSIGDVLTLLRERVPRRHDLQDPLLGEPGPGEPRALAVGLPQVLRGRRGASPLGPPPAAGAFLAPQGDPGSPGRRRPERGSGGGACRRRVGARGVVRSWPDQRQGARRGPTRWPEPESPGAAAREASGERPRRPGPRDGRKSSRRKPMTRPWRGYWPTHLAGWRACPRALVNTRRSRRCPIPVPRTRPATPTS